eukprot:XP_011662202.1 PREDICTED: uncharacterized protein LOC105437380 [Strongylocentrotus purpuratus]
MEIESDEEHDPRLVKTRNDSNPVAESRADQPALKRMKRAPMFDIKKILSHFPKGEAVMEQMIRKKFASREERVVVTHALVGFIISKHTARPSSQLKEILAHDLTDAFPFLRDPKGETGYEAWFIKGRHGRSASGYLEAHLKYVRRCMNQHSKGNVHSGVKKLLS